MRSLYVPRVSRSRTLHSSQVNAQTAERPTDKGIATNIATQSPRSQLGRFTILRQLGAGGMGTVFAAYDEQLDRKVALKLLHNHDDRDQTQRERVLREAKALARVKHPRVVAIYDVGTTSGQLYLAMEFIDGVTLRTWQQERSRSWREILLMYIQAGEGLCAAHEAGVIHRDFKPDNVLVGKDGLPRVLDFGVARFGWQSAVESYPDGDAPCDGTLFTYKGIHSGTPGYMSPEQYGDEPVSASSDQFSFCSALYEALCGYLPFAGTTAAEQAVSVRGSMRPAPLRAEFPEEVLRILARGLSVDPRARFSSMMELLSALSIEQGQTPAGSATSRRRLIWLLTGCTILALLVVEYLSAHRVRMYREAAGVSITLVSLTLIAGHIHKRALSTNLFHRWIYTHLLSAFCQNLLFRLSMIALAPLPFRSIFTIEMVIWTGATALMASQPARSLYWVPAVPILASVICLTFPNLPRGVLLLTYPLIVGCILWGWNREAKSRR